MPSPDSKIPPKALTKAQAAKAGVLTAVPCPYKLCLAPAGSPCPGGLAHPSRVDAAIRHDYNRRYREWSAMPEVIARQEQERKDREREQRIREDEAHRRQERADARAADRLARKVSAAAAARKSWLSAAEGRTTQQRVLDALAALGEDGGTAFQVAKSLGIEQYLLPAVHSALRTAHAQGLVTREVVPCFGARFTGGTTSVYRPAEGEAHNVCEGCGERSEDVAPRHWSDHDWCDDCAKDHDRSRCDW